VVPLVLAFDEELLDHAWKAVERRERGRIDRLWRAGAHRPRSSERGGRWSDRDRLEQSAS
jgi:hypothetical protein